MDCKQGKRLWRGAAISSYLGMNIGALVITAVVPLAIICIGETDLQEVTKRVSSFMPFSYWLIGIGGITIFFSSLAVLASFAKSRGFKIFVAVGLVINVAAGLALLIWGLIPTEGRKSYFQEAWTEADLETKDLIQSYYSCCGFESAVEYGNRLSSSCYANEDLLTTWQDGCYDRLTTVTVHEPEIVTSSGDDTVEGGNKFNVFLLAYLLPLSILVTIQLMSTIIFIVGCWKYSSSGSNFDVTKANNAEIFKNRKEEIESISHDGETGSVASNGSRNKNNSIGTDAEVTSIAANDFISEKEGGTNKKKSCFHRIPDAISSTMENGFYWLGELVGRNPKATIVTSLIVTGVLFIGLLQLQDQPTGSAGFLPEDAPIIKEYVASRQTFIQSERDQVFLIVDDDNILTKEKFDAMLEIDKKVRDINGTNGKFSLLCYTVLAQCKERSLFELWGFDENIISQLSTEDILEKLNGKLESPIFGDELDITAILGGIKRNAEGKIIGAKVHKMEYVIGRKDDEWEKAFIDIGNAQYDSFTVYVESRGSRTFESRGGYQKELPFLFAGFGLIFVYIILMTGRFSLLEHRTYIALMGIVTAGLSMGSGIGLSASFGFKWSVIHLVAPFLIIGIGVDDMFILIQAWNTVEDDPKLKKLSLAERSGYALKSAGVSITVTSVTDLVAFAVGSSSELGSFASFSIYIAISIILLFFLQCTFFLACTVLDQRRREERYDACLACCYKHGENYRPSECSKREFFATFFEDGLGKIVQFLPVQIVVILITVVLTCFMGWGFTMLKVGFDPNWYLPQDSYLISFDEQYEKYFPAGQEAAVYVINADFYKEREKLHLLYNRLKKNQDINPNMTTSWFEKYSEWMNTDKNVSNIYAPDSYVNAQQFYSTVNEFLRGKGRVFARDVATRRGIIIGSKFEIQHKEVAEKVDNVDIVDSVHADCDAVGFSDFAFPFNRIYFNFHIMKIIRTEVYRNLGITLLCVFLMVLPMIASVQMSFWVVICVVFTIIDVAGSMHFAGLTIETSTIITLLLSVGLAVDYAAHIAHKFLTLKGTRKMRARVTLGQIGSAVFNGGFSTFLALVLLAGTDTYSYKVFFTVFVCVVGYGLWNGLVFLPCVLGLMGPPPHITAREARLSQRHQARKGKVENEEEMTQIENPYIDRT